MKIELKNVKFYPSMSEETNCFQADIFINGVKAGHAKNEGCGGETHCQSYMNQKSIYQAGEAYCKSLPPYKTEHFSFDMNMEFYVDELFETWAKAKYDKQNAKKLEKDMKTGIIFNDNKGQQRMHYWKNYTIETLLKHPSGLAMLTKTVAKIKSEGGTILNTNLPKEVL